MPVTVNKRSFPAEIASWLTPSLWPLWLAVAALAIGVGLAVSACVQIVRATQSKSWPAARGVITSFQASMPLQTRNGTRYSVDIEYRFRISNRAYTGSGFDLDSSDLVDQEDCDALRRMYPVGKVVLVYYNPRDVHQTVLESRVGAGNGVRFFLGGIFAFLGMAGLTLLHLSARSRQA